MANGENGASGAHVRRRVNRENNQEHVNVIPHLPNKEERNVMARHRKVKFVTTAYLAQVSFKCRHAGGFPRKLVLVFQNESSLQNLSCENKFGFHENEPVEATHFLITEWFRTKTCFDKKAKGYSEKAYTVLFYYSRFCDFWFFSVAGFPNFRLYFFAAVLLTQNYEDGQNWARRRDFMTGWKKK